MAKGTMQKKKKSGYCYPHKRNMRRAARIHILKCHIVHKPVPKIPETCSEGYAPTTPPHYPLHRSTKNITSKLIGTPRQDKNGCRQCMKQYRMSKD